MDAGLVQVRDVEPPTLAVLRERARSLGQSRSGYLRDLMDADATTETNAALSARIARHPVWPHRPARCDVGACRPPPAELPRAASM